MKKTLFALLSVAFLAAGCQEWEPVLTLSYDNPAEVTPVTMTPNTTIAELCARYEQNTPWEIDENIIIGGVVSTTDQPGNFYKSFYMQDATGGIEIKVGRNALYNIYHPGQTIYVRCQGLTLGMYGYKSGTSNGQGMVQLGYKDPNYPDGANSYETAYMESPLIVDAHVYRGAQGELVEPVVISESELPTRNQTQASNKYIGKLVTVKNLSYGWVDSYGTYNEAFVLLYLDSTKDKKASSNRIFVSGKGTGITTWAMSKAKMTENLMSGMWDDISIGNANDYNYGKVGDDWYKYPHEIVDVPAADGKPAKKDTVYNKEIATYPEIERAAGSVSQYFKTPGGTCIQLRTSGFSKFCDEEIPQAVLEGKATIDITGILSMYQGKIQMVVNSLDDIKINN